MILMNSPNSAQRILKYNGEEAVISDELIAKVAKHTECTIEEIQKAVEKYFPEEKTSLDIQSLINQKAQSIKESTK